MLNCITIASLMAHKRLSGGRVFLCGEVSKWGLRLVREPLLLWGGLRREWKALWRESDTVPGTVVSTCIGMLKC